MVSRKSATQDQKMIRKRILIFSAFVSLGFGVAGLFLPLLPTTPFVLLSAFCFMKSSPVRYKWLISHRVFGKYISDYITQKAMPIRAKVSAIIFMWLTMTISALLVSNSYVTVMLAVIGCVVTLHILSLRTRLKEDKVKSNADDTVL